MSDWYQIENSNLIVQISSNGAEMKRLFAKPWNREILWVPKDEQERKIWNRSAPVLFPIVGKLIQDEYTFKGKKYHLSQHGFARDTEFKCTKCSFDEIHFYLEATQETFKSYPFCFELEIHYKLEERTLFVDYSVKNTDRQDIFFSIGAHPGFSLNHQPHEIHFEKKERGYFRLDQNKQVNFKQLTAMISNEMVVEDSWFKQDAMIFKDLKSKHIDLVNLATNETIRMNGTNTPYFGVWAKDGVPFVCLEPWYGVADVPNHDQNLENKLGIQTLTQGAIFKFNYSIEMLP